MPVRRADDNAYVLGANVSANGSAVSIKGGEYMFLAEGTAGGATISLQIKSLNGTWEVVQSLGGSYSVTTGSLPYNATPIILPSGDVRLGVTGGAPSALYGYLIGMG